MELIGQFVIAGLVALAIIAWRRKREGKSAEADPGLAVIQQLKKVGSMRPDHAALTATRRELEQLASELDCEYDGWGTPGVN